MNKTILLVILSFIVGFCVHAFFFPDVLSSIVVNPNALLSNTLNPSVTPFTLEPLIREITYDGEHFSKHTVTVGKTRYLSITNKSDTPMILTSNVSDLITPRPYMKEEMVKAQFNTAGTYIVQLKTNPHEQLVITVK